MYGSNSVAVAQQCADVLLLIRIDSNTCSNHSPRIAASQELCAALCEQVLNGLAYLHDQQAHTSHMSTHKTARVYRNVQMIRSNDFSAELVLHHYCFILWDAELANIRGHQSAALASWLGLFHALEMINVLNFKRKHTHSAHAKLSSSFVLIIQFEINPLPGFHRFSRV